MSCARAWDKISFLAFSSNPDVDLAGVAGYHLVWSGGSASLRSYVVSVLHKVLKGRETSWAQIFAAGEQLDFNCLIGSLIENAAIFEA